MTLAPRDSPDRLEALLAQAEGLRDPQARELARELVREVLALHAAGLARVLAIAGAHASGSMVDALVGDPLVSNLLVLHGLHPHDLEARVRAGLAHSEPELVRHGARVELEELAGGVARLRLDTGAACAGTQRQLKAAVEAALAEAAPDLAGVELVAERSEGSFVPLSRLRSPRGAEDAR